MTRDLPSDTDAALAAVAAGWGREPTYAHPACRCGRPKPPLPKYTDAAAYMVALREWTSEHGPTRDPRYQRQDCPMHRRTT